MIFAIVGYVAVGLRCLRNPLFSVTHTRIKLPLASIIRYCGLCRRGFLGVMSRGHLRHGFAGSASLASVASVAAAALMSTAHTSDADGGGYGVPAP